MSKKQNKNPQLEVEEIINSAPVLPINISLPEDAQGKTTYEQKILNEHITDEDQIYLISKIGKDGYQKFFAACLDWNYAVTQKSIGYSLSNNCKDILNELLNSESFINIINVHKELIDKEQKGILTFLENLISHQKYNFLIIYMFLTKQIYPNTHNVYLYSFGFTQDILNILIEEK